MTFLTALTPSVLEACFPFYARHGYVSSVQTIHSKLDLIGFVVGERTWYVTAFSGEDFDGDLGFASELARKHTVFEPDESLLGNACVMKFSRADAHPDTQFQQTSLPKGVGLWEFERILMRACVRYLLDRPEVLQFYFLPINDVLERRYKRLSNAFCQPGGALGCGVTIRQIATPIEGEGGFYGYQRCN